MLFIRSLAFNIAFYANLLLWLLLCLPTLVLPRPAAIRMAQAWGRSNLWLMRVLVGTRVEFRGRERIPAGPLLVAAKHQSIWETFALLSLFDRPAFVLKRELTWLPFFGQLLIKADMIPVDRGGGRATLAAMTRRAAETAHRGHQILIFPEGTRRPPGAAPAYKAGLGFLYAHLGVPCLPVALNSGAFWPRRRFGRRPGTIVVEFLPAIAPGEPRETFARRLQAELESASERLLAEAEREAGRSLRACRDEAVPARAPL